MYHRKLQPDWEVSASRLAARLQVSLVGRSRKQKIVIGNTFVKELLAVEGRTYCYIQYEQAFTQPNAGVNTAMLTWACQRAASVTGDLLELYCGNGNFTLPLARHFDHVIATELAKTSVRAARENLASNGIDNADHSALRGGSHPGDERGAGISPSRRTATAPAGLRPAHDFVDLPRAGLDPHTVQMVAGFEAIIYISCNPHTLAENLAVLCAGHRIEQFALFDQFPYTDHMECGVFLRRKQVASKLRHSPGYGG